MSVRVMALIFAHKFPRLKTTVKVKGSEVEKNVLQVSSKAVMLALGDHASDDGEGAYPSLTTLEIKTGLSRPALVTTLGALKKHGYLSYVGVSKLGTSKYKINTDQLTAFTEVVNAVNQPSKQRLPEPVNSVNPIHPSIHPKPSINKPAIAGTRAKPTNDLHPIAEALAEVCKMSLEANGGRLFSEAKLLAKATPAPTPELIKMHYNGDPKAFWKSKDWRGMKGAYPTPSQVRETWVQATSAKATGWESIDTDELQRQLDAGEI